MGKGLVVDISLDEHIKRQKKKAQVSNKKPANKSGNNGSSQKSNNNKKNNNRGKSQNRRNNQSVKRHNSRKPIVKKKIHKTNKNVIKPTGNRNRNNRNNNNNGNHQKQGGNSQHRHKPNHIIQRTGSQNNGGATKNVKNLKRIIVSNLPTEVTNADVFELFSQFGPMNVCKIRYDKLGKSYGIAVVEYKDETYAKKAVREYNGAQLDNEVLSIQYATKKVPIGQGNGGSLKPSLKSRIIPRSQRQQAARNIKKNKNAKVNKNKRRNNNNNNGNNGNGNGNSNSNRGGRARSRGGRSKGRASQRVNRN